MEIKSKLLQKMLERGFGLYSINELLSLKIHEDSIELCVAELPGNPGPVYLPIYSRNIAGISNEIYDFIGQYMTIYLAKIQNDVLNL